MSFDNFYHVDLGNIVTLLGTITSLYLLHIANVKRITRMEFKVGLMWRRFAQRFNLDENLDDEKNYRKDDF